MNIGLNSLRSQDPILVKKIATKPRVSLTTVSQSMQATIEEFLDCEHTHPCRHSKHTIKNYRSVDHQAVQQAYAIMEILAKINP